MLAELVLSRVTTLMLVVARLAGFVAVSPFPGPEIAMQARVGLVLLLAWPVTLQAGGALGPPSIGLVPVIATELGCGVAMALAFRLTLSAADLVGTMTAQALGLSSASLFDPATEQTDSVASRVVTLFALSLALAVGAHRVVLLGVLESFQVVPLGGLRSFAPVGQVLVDLASDSFAAGLRLSLPLAGLAVTLQLALATVSRAAPTLQLFSVGWPLLLLTGFAALKLGARDLAQGLTRELAALAGWLDQVLAALRSG